MSLKRRIVLETERQRDKESVSERPIKRECKRQRDRLKDKKRGKGERKKVGRKRCQ